MILKRYTLATLAPLTLIELFSKMLKFSTKKRKKIKIKKIFLGEGKYIKFSRIFFFEMKNSKLINYLTNVC